jgi:hypothetical protein
MDVKYVTTGSGSLYFYFLGESYTKDEDAQKRRAAMTHRDWAMEQILTMAESGPLSKDDIIFNLKHCRDTVFDRHAGQWVNEIPEQITEIRKATRAHMQAGLDDLDNILAELMDKELLEQVN